MYICTLYTRTPYEGSRGMREALTEQQQNVLEFVENYGRQHGFPPTLREIGRGIGLRNVNAVRGHLTALERKGYLTRVPDRARSVKLVERPSTISRMKQRLHQLLRTDQGVLHQLVYGLAWTTRGHEPWLVGPLAEALTAALHCEAIEHGWSILQEHIEPNYVAVVLQTWPNHSPQLAVKRLQTAIKAVQREHPKLMVPRPFWERGYVVTTDPAILPELVARFLKDH